MKIPAIHSRRGVKNKLIKVTIVLFIDNCHTRTCYVLIIIVPAICLMAAESARRFSKWASQPSYYRSV
jgi:hypothetical protein